MQGQEELTRESVHDAGEPGEVSLHQVAGGQSGDSLERVGTCCNNRLLDGKASSCGGEGLPSGTAGGADPGELSGAWGEFEGFQESSVKFEQFSQRQKLLQRPAEPQRWRAPPAPREHGSQQPHQAALWVTGTAVDPSPEPVVSYKNIFRFAFQEVTVEQTTEDVSTLDHFLEANKEENPGLSSVHRLCSESRKLWRNLQNTDAMSMSQCLWSESRCQENLFLVLGVDAAQKIPSGSQGHILQGLSLKEPEELLAVSSFRLHHCKALIQTKPPGTITVETTAGRGTGRQALLPLS
ncbi:PREDICTED: uncharacterized protein C14orf79 homolog isoform X2 [Chinchilla lanigera]|uniref:uncharacterized protein C14orf79 homolog isoform X2 n=2 Tax=Chinchilla lanigera TaxID=34839 RepID=UPI000696DCB6|nr:PREDICTED: uncharacterized protein C14orf79 homolog isoform X2 [Chinchilla lanigera]